MKTMPDELAFERKNNKEGLPSMKRSPLYFARCQVRFAH